MENTTPNQYNELKSKNTTNKIMLVLIILLFGFCSFLIWQNNKLKNVVAEKEIVYVEVSAERDNVKTELEAMLAQYNTLKTNNSEISAELEVEKAKIEDLLKNIKGKDWSIFKLKKETDTLRKIMKGFVVQIDSLNTVNKELRAEKDKLQNKTIKLHKQIEKLKQQNDTLNQKNDELKLEVQLGTATPNELLNTLIQRGQVTHFVEKIPSVNDIFIKTVTE